MPDILILTSPDGSEAHRVTLPTSWADVTTAQYLALLEPTAPWVAQLTGLAPDVLASLSEGDAVLLTDRLSFALEHGPLLQLLPTPALYEVGNCCYGLLLRSEEFLAAHPDVPALMYGAYLCALYRGPLLPDALDKEILAGAYAAVLAAPITETFADAQHLLASYAHAKDGSTLPGPRQAGMSQLMPVEPARGGLRTRLGDLVQTITQRLAHVRLRVLGPKPAALASIDSPTAHL